MTDPRPDAPPASSIADPARPLAGRVALVTGAGRGIGRAIAEGYARAGAAIGLLARSTAQLDETRARIEAAGGAALAMPADVTDADSLARAFDAVAARFGGIDLVVANAGASVQNARVEDSDVAAWRQTVEVNLIGSFLTARTAIAHLRRRGGGKLIFIGSGMGHRSGPTRSAYAASKAGLWMLVRVLAQELQAEGIAVNELVPGPVLTEFIAGRADALNASTGGGEWFKQPEDVVPLALFIAGQPANGPTGQSFSLARRDL